MDGWIDRQHSAHRVCVFTGRDAPSQVRLASFLGLPAGFRLLAGLLAILVLHSYTQGMNFLVGIALLAGLREEHCFWWAS